MSDDLDALKESLREWEKETDTFAVQNNVKKPNRPRQGGFMRVPPAALMSAITCRPLLALVVGLAIGLAVRMYAVDKPMHEQGLALVGGVGAALLLLSGYACSQGYAAPPSLVFFACAGVALGFADLML